MGTVRPASTLRRAAIKQIRLKSPCIAIDTDWSLPMLTQFCATFDARFSNIESYMTQTGADLLTRTLAANGVNTSFANPGTTEMHLLAALGAEQGVALHLCLFEGVATGAADGRASSGSAATPLAVVGERIG